MSSIEKKNKRTGMRNSLIIHALLLLIVFFFGFSTPSEKALKTPPPVTVDFSYTPSSLSKYARAEEGKAKPKTEKVTKIEKVKPKPVITPKPKMPVPIKPKNPDPLPTDPIVTDAIQEEAPVEAVDEEVEVEEPEQEVLTEDDLAELEEEEQIEETVEEVTSTTSESEESSDEAQDASVLEGNEGGTGKGQEGDGPGRTEGSDNTEGEGEAGDGTGEYDDSGNGVFGRRVIYRDMDAVLKGMNNTNGVIVMKFCVNRAGDVTYAEINEDETTETNRPKLKQLLKAIRKYKVEPDPRAPAEQCGKYKFNLNINALN